MLESEEMRSTCGWVFNGYIGLNVCVHLFFLIRSSVADCKKRCKKRHVSSQSQNRNNKTQVDAEDEKQTLPVENPRKLRKLARKNKLARLKVQMDKISEEDDDSRLSSKN